MAMLRGLFEILQECILKILASGYFFTLCDGKKEMKTKLGLTIILHPVNARPQMELSLHYPWQTGVKSMGHLNVKA